MLISQILSILFPIVAIVAIGYGFARLRALDLASINHLNMALFNPALLFSVLSGGSFNLGEYQQLALAGILIVLGSGLLVLPLIQWLNIEVKTFIPSIMFMNTGNMGIPVALFTFGEAALPAAAVLLITNALLHFSLGIWIVSGQAHGLTLLKLPLIQATLAGLLISFTSISLPQTLLQPIQMLGDCAIPLMLISLGVRLAEIDFTQWRIGLLGACLRPISGILLYLGISPWLNLPPMQNGLLLIFAILPPAVFNYIIAEQYQQEPHKVAAIVMLGNIASLISLPLALSFAL